MKVSNIPFWYYEYTIQYYDDVEDCSYERSGVITANTIIEAVELLCDFYGESQIENIFTLKSIAEGGVLDFQEINKNEDIDLFINKV